MQQFKEFLNNEGFWKDAIKSTALGAAIGTAGAISVLPKYLSHKSEPLQYQSVDNSVSSQSKISPDIKYIANYIAKNEGKSNKMYKDGVGNPTIGIGHLLGPDSKSVFAHLFGDNFDFNGMITGTSRLSEDQIDTLFQYDLNKHLNRVKAKLPQFNSYPIYVKAALLDAVYRGDLGHKTCYLINQNKWKEAAQEYLNNKQYINRAELNLRGIGPRMERNQSAMLKYAQSQQIKASF